MKLVSISEQRRREQLGELLAEEGEPCPPNGFVRRGYNRRKRELREMARDRRLLGGERQ